MTMERKGESKDQSPDAGARWLKYVRAAGPGLITGASDDDPSGIATYAQAGSKYGLSFLWGALLSFPLMTAVQEICDRTDLATGKGLGELAADRFERFGKTIIAILLAILVMANTLNIAAALLIIVTIVSNNRRLMGDYVNGHAANILGWVTCAVMAVASIALFATGGISF